MKKALSLFSLLIVALFSFTAGFYFFFPRDAAAGFLWRRAVLAAADKGVNLELASLSVEGYFPFRVVLRNLRVTSPIASMEAGDVVVVPVAGATLFSFALVADILGERASLVLPLPGRQPLFLASFASRVSFRPPLVSFSQVETAGDLEISGEARVDINRLMLDEADLSIRGEQAGVFESFRSFLPLTRDASGGWTLKREGKSRES